MHHRRLLIAGLSLAVALTGVTGCAGDGTTPSGPGGAAPATTVAADPAVELAAATTKLGDTTMKIRMDMAEGATMSGVADARAKKSAMTMTSSTGGQKTVIETRQIGNDVWMKLPPSMSALLGSQSAKPWLHVDVTSLGKNSSLNASNAGADAAAKLVRATSGVKRTGDHQFAGTIDLAKAQTMNAKLLDSLGAKAKAVPFTAKTDDEGRLVELAVDMSAIAPSAGTLTTHYSDFGTPVDVEAPPAGDVGELPSKLKSIFGGI